MTLLVSNKELQVVLALSGFAQRKILAIESDLACYQVFLAVTATYQNARE